MHMTVNQSGQDGRAAQVDGLRAGGELASGRHARYGAGIDKERLVELQAAGGGAIDQSTSTNYGCSIMHR